MKRDEAALIEAQLVDVHNVAAHKCVKLTIHVPAEHALKVIKAFGWPTMVDPVPVAVVGLNHGKEVAQAERKGPEERMGNPSSPGRDAQPRQASPHDLGGAQRRDWVDLSPATQAGIICGERPFWRYLSEQGTYRPECAEDAAEAVRAICGVSSRRDIGESYHALVIWHSLVDAYRAWQKAPECVP